MPDPLDVVLGLVADGRLSAEEAAPVIDALQVADAFADDGATVDGATSDGDRPAGSTTGSTPRALRIEVAEGGRKVVNLRVPLSLGRMALDNVPGLSNDTITRIREALDRGATGPILVIDERGDGDGVRIVLE